MENKRSLSDRMKEYEAVAKTKLMKRTPVLIRIDGKAFHTFTKGMHKPFDSVLQKTMQDTMEYLCKNVQNCKLGYTQSDEITLVLIDYENFDTSAWFDNEVQKIVSVAASLATLAFNRLFRENVANWYLGKDKLPISNEKIEAIYANYQSKFDKALFDARAFNVAKEEVANALIWRQQDAVRNSIQAVGQANFGKQKMENKSCKKIKEMLIEEKGFSWEQYKTLQKRGSCCLKDSDGNWMIDNEVPTFSEDRDYIETLVFLED